MATRAPLRPRAVPVRLLLTAGLLLSLLLAGVVSAWASSKPDGLNRVAADKGFAAQERDSATGESPLADYGVRGVEDERLSGGLAGVVGCVVVLALAGGLTRVLRARGADNRRAAGSAAAGSPPDR